MKTNFEAINIGTGQSVSIKYIAEKMVSILAPQKEIIFNKLLRSGDIKDSRADIQRAQKILGWQPFTKIDYAIKSYCEYILENWDSFKTNIDTCKEADSKLREKNLFRNAE